MEARQGNKNKLNIYVSDKDWDHDRAVMQAHDEHSATWLVAAINNHINNSGRQNKPWYWDLPKVQKAED